MVKMAYDYLIVTVPITKAKIRVSDIRFLKH
ncbi:hypothetical protein EV207_11722 [Scopulibacillus darangshiensis]|uniref:Uncharacterized protein n=1 Tax=Scopulibacillus darangshiensis TaxID=442528 RepID=A0A4R2P280_9BACL|nr:hypothetical protein EV207_11722 [Scopulibacillus darangshiensis]